MVWVKESPRYASLFNYNYAKTKPVKLLLSKYRNNTLDMNNETEKLFVDELKEKIKKELKKKSSKIPFYEGMELFAIRLGEVARGMEMRSRFAAFMTSRQLGRTIDRSIWDAKEISVNFNI